MIFATVFCTTATAILSRIFHEATSKRPRLETEHMKLLVTQQLESMDLSHFWFDKYQDDAIQLLCLAAKESVNDY